MENCRQEICRCCLQEIPNPFAATYLIEKPEEGIRLGEANLAETYLECYYFCMARDCNKLPPKESLIDYGRICFKCKEGLMEATKFIVSAKVNESFILSILGSNNRSVVNRPSVKMESTNKLIIDAELIQDNELELEFKMIEEYLESSENESSIDMDEEKNIVDLPTIRSPNADLLLNEKTSSNKDDCNSLETIEEIVFEAANNNNCVLEETTLLGCEQPNVNKWQLEQYLCFNCELCTKVFNLESQLYKHYNDEHDEKTFGFPCDICKRRHVSFKALRYHRHRDHKNYKYVDCETCGKAVVAKFYKRHKDHHIFRCDKCDKSYKSKFKLHKHMRMTHELVREKRYDCPECNRHFFSSNNLKLHSITHQNNTNSNSNQGYVFNCDICSQSFSRPVYLKQHLDSHRGDIMKCPHCSKQFTRLTDIETHMRLHIIKDSQQFELGDQLSEQHKRASYQCPFCDKIFQSSFDLRRHSYAHSGWPFTCNLCNKGFSSVYIIRRHLKAVHCEQFANRYTDDIADTLYKRHRIKEIFPRASNIL